MSSKFSFATAAPLRLDAAMRARVDRIYRTGLAVMPDAGNWYADCFFNIQSILSVYDDQGHPLRDDSDSRTFLFIDLLAATSPQASIRRNTFLATQVFQYIRNATLCREPMKFQAHLDNVCRCLLGLPVSGPKVTAFRANLLGENKPVTIDSWMMRVFLQSDRKAPENDEEYRRMEQMVRTVAAEYGVTPSAMQAILWVGIKDEEGDPSDTPEPFEKTLIEFLENPNKPNEQGEFEFKDEPAKFEREERKLAEENRTVAFNKGGGFTSPRVVGPRMKEICVREAGLSGKLVDVLCAQPEGLLMDAVLYCRHRMDAWRSSKKAGAEAADELQGVMAMAWTGSAGSALSHT